MIPVGTAAQVRALDAALIDTLGVPGAALMELAGRGAAEAIHALPPGPVGILCGPGNNGGDGLVVARWLALWGREVRLWIPRPPQTADAQANHALCQALALPTVPSPAAALRGAAIGVDALLGTGQRSAPRGALLDGVGALQAARRSGVTIAALDLPTGVCADTGAALGDAVAADLTVTFGWWKLGLLCEPGASLAGRTVVVDIGLALARCVDPALLVPAACLLEAADVAAWKPQLRASDAKWDRGHVAVRAGGGAAVLAAHGAFRAGAGLVTLLAPRSMWPALHGLWPEVILAEPAALSPRRHDALVLGPGLGLEAGEEVRRLWGSFPGAVLADADALTLLAQARPEPPAGAVRLVTPHAAEAARLLGTSRAAVEADRPAAVAALAAIAPAVLKGPGTLIAAGQQTLVVPVRCPALGTAGSGDVLAGVIGGLLARKLPPLHAAAVGAWWHGHAGLQLPPGGTASDLLAQLSRR